jgi:signal transduction histidine kinase
VALGRPVAEVLGPDLAREFELARKEGGIRNLYKFRLSVGGRDKTVNLAIAPLVTRFFQRIGHIVLIDDITTEVELEQRLAQTDRLSSVGLLAAGVAHEVNTPLAVISSYTQLLSKQISGNDPKARVLEKITQQTFRASEIIGNLLNFSRTGGTEFREVDINAVVKDTLALVDHPLRTARVTPVAALAADLPSIQGNPGKLQQVFLNLILNARDAMPEGGTLQVRSRAVGDAIIVEVMDSGEGIPSELHHRIFDPFFTTKQADRSSGTMSSGTGLGLAVTYGIVQEHGGVIAVESEPQRGTCFRLEFPALRKVVHA